MTFMSIMTTCRGVGVGLLLLLASIGQAQTKPASLSDDLRTGDAKTRIAAMRRGMADPQLLKDAPLELLDAAIVGASDVNPPVREETARFVGVLWVRDRSNPPDKAIELGLKLRKDPEWDVRHYAIFFILSVANPKSDAVIEALLDSAVVEANVDDVRKIAAELKAEKPDRLRPFFARYWKNIEKEPEHARRAAKMWKDITGQDGPAVAVGSEYVHAFKNLYNHLGKTYPCFEMKKIDWKKVGDELLPQADKVKTDDDFGKLCMQLVARLEDSHAHLEPGKAQLPKVEFPRYETGFFCLIDDRDRPVVYHVIPHSPADDAGVKVGMTVGAINGKPVADAMNGWSAEAKKWSGYSSDRMLRYDAVRAFACQMTKGAIVKLEMQDPAGKTHAFEIAATLDSPYTPRLPVPIPGIKDNSLVEAKKLDDRTGYLYVRRIRGGFPDQLDAALEKLGKIDALVIDVRGNSGGGFDAEKSFVNFDPDDHAEPNRPHFTGPIALIFDERCISAGEGWASWFIAKNRARTFGSTTAGASSAKEEYTLTNGLFKVVVPIRPRRGWLDRPIERRGLEPDVPVRCSATDLSAESDTVLKAARQWLKQQLR